MLNMKIESLMNVVGKFFGNIEWHNMLVLLSNGKGGWKKYYELLEFEINHIIIFESYVVSGYGQVVNVKGQFLLLERKNV